jgi:hypothetical protein
MLLHDSLKRMLSEIAPLKKQLDHGDVIGSSLFPLAVARLESYEKSEGKSKYSKK